MSRVRGTWLLFAAAALWLLQAAAAPQEAKQLVERTTDQVLERLEQRRAELERNPGELYHLIEDLVLPHFDFARMSQWVLGRYWRQADDDQRSRFVEAFRNLLVRTYGTALLEYTGQEIRYLPVQAPDDAEELTVRTEIAQSSGPAIGLDYRMYRNDGEWKVYDVVIDGISLVTNYRGSFASTIRRSGIDDLIHQLEKRNEKSGS